MKDDLTPKTRLILIFLFQVSDMAGRCAPGYDAIKKGAKITSRVTVAEAIQVLRQRGWFHFIKKRNGKNAVFHLRIPPRFQEEEKAANVTRFPEARKSSG